MNEIDKLREELKQTRLAYQMAVQMSQFKAGFLARTSHELRSPLSSMIGLHQLILSDLCESPEEQKEFVAQAYHSALKLMKLIDEIVAVSKTEYGSNRLNLEILQLTEIFTEIERLTHLPAANRNLKLKIIYPNSQVKVFADRSRLIQLIFNLIDSGISLMDTGAIELTTTEVSADTVTIQIDFDCPITLWQQAETTEPNFENNDITQIQQFVREIGLSANMKLLLSQTLLETMGGTLKLLDSTQIKQPLTRLVLTCKRNK